MAHSHHDSKIDLKREQPTAHNEPSAWANDDLYKGQKFDSHNPKAENELVRSAERFPDGPLQVLLNYMMGGIENIKALPREALQKFTLFGKTVDKALLPIMAQQVATLILGGEAQEVEDAIALVKKYPDMLHCRVNARDRSGSPGFCLMNEKTDAELSEGKKHLYIKQAEDGGLDYKVLSPAGNIVQGHITRDELNQKEIKEPLTLHTLNALAGSILDITSSRGHTPLGRRVEGKLLQIAAMAGDVNLQDEKEIKREEDRGIVERLISIPGGLSREEAAKQLDEVITGEKAQRENEQRNNRILDAVRAFGNGILRKASEYKGDKEDYNNFREFQQLCQPCINELEQALRFNPKEVIKSGYILDPAILQESIAWFEKKLSDFGGWYSIVSDVFWVNGFGKLQLTLSARDKHVMRHGLGIVVNDKEIPLRALNNDNGASFLVSSSSCGRDFFLDYHGLWAVRPPACRRAWRRNLENLCQSKTAALQKLCNVSSKQIRACDQ